MLLIITVKLMIKLLCNLVVQTYTHKKGITLKISTDFRQVSHHKSLICKCTITKIHHFFVTAKSNITFCNKVHAKIKMISLEFGASLSRNFRESQRGSRGSGRSLRGHTHLVSRGRWSSSSQEEPAKTPPHLLFFLLWISSFLMTPRLNFFKMNLFQ